MNELKCPKCGTVFKIDENDYESILSQVRNDEFNKLVLEKERQYKNEKESELKIIKTELDREHFLEITQKDKEIEDLKNKLNVQHEKNISEIENVKIKTLASSKDEVNQLELELANLRKELENNKDKYEATLSKINEQKNLEVENIKSATETRYNKEIKELELKVSNLQHDLASNKSQYDSEISKIKSEKELEVKNVKSDTENLYNEEINSLKLKISNLEGDIKLKDSLKQQEVEKINLEKEQEITSLKNKLEISKTEYELKEKTLKESYDSKLKSKDEMIDYYKDLKARQSTKIVGESLEQHCNYEFSRIRNIFGKNTYFEKDNDARTGSKGDFIFRDYDEEGNEIVSIMFEMKNESLETVNKHKNEDFFKELDKDRKEKKCEYAVLVSLLEIDNEIYNSGIVDVSYKYEKMYVIRPQFFVPIITMLRNASLKALDYKKQLVLIQNQSVDISNFEDNINKFKEGFARNYRLASEKFSKAIDEIDATITHLQKIKDALLSSDRNLRIANDKADSLTIKKLINGNKTMTEMFEQLKNQTEDEEV